MDSPYTSGSDPGYDPATGYGFIQADRTLDEILGTSNTNIASSSTKSVEELATGSKSKRYRLCRNQLERFRSMDR